MKKRNLKDVLFGITIGGLIFGGIGVAAITLTANEIKYTPNNEISTATNASDAIDELYTMTSELKKGELKLVGTSNSFNIADIVGIENIGKYTKDDFIVVENLSNNLLSDYVDSVQGTYSYYPARMKFQATLINDFDVKYDNLNGNVVITNKKINITAFGEFYNAGGGAVWQQSLQADYIFSIPPKVYLYV